MSVFDTQLGISAEVTVGTWVAPARSIPYISQTLEGVFETIKTPGIRAGQFMDNDSDYLPVAKGAGGQVVVTPWTKGFGLWLKQMFGAVSIGALTSGKYLQTHTPGPLAGISFATEVYKPYVSATKSGNVFRYAGCKIPQWTLGMAMDDYLRAALTIDAMSETASDTLTAAVYPSSTEAFAYPKCTITVGGTEVEVQSWEITCNTAMAAERYKIRTSQLKDEQIENARRTMSIKLTGVEFETMTHYNRVAAALAANRQAAIVIAMTGSADTAATFGISIPSAVAMSGLDLGISDSKLMIEQSLSFEIKTPTAGTAGITVTYNSADAAI